MNMPESMGESRPRSRDISLEALLARSIRLGQRRVALRRLLMLEARGLGVSQEAHAYCEPMRASLPWRELVRMQASAETWARTVSGRDGDGFRADV